MRRFLFALCLLAPLAASRAEAPAPKRTLLKAARWFDARRGMIAKPGAVLVEGERILAVGEREATGAAATGADVIDLGDATLLPGLIDAHTHLSFEASGSWADDQLRDLLAFPAEHAQRAATYARRTVESGVTTVRDMGGWAFVDIAVRNAIESGAIVGPRVLAAGHAIGTTGSHADLDPLRPDRFPPLDRRHGVCDDADSCRAAVRWQVKFGADVIKLVPAGGVLSLHDPVDAPEMSQEEMNAAVAEAHAWGRKVGAHSHGDTPAKMAIRAGVDSIEHASFLRPDTLAEMKRRGVYLVPTMMTREISLTNYPPSIQAKRRAAQAAHDEMMKTAIKLGVKIASGSDSGVTPHGRNPHEVVLLVKEVGVSPAAALQAATVNDADLLGLSQDVGALEKGKYADIIAVPGDPITDITVIDRVSFVMKSGRVLLRGPAPAPAPAPKRILLRAARMFDGRGDQNINNGAVLVESGRIVAAGANIAAPPDAEIIDLGDATLLPGLMDAHTHITGEAKDTYAQTFVERIFTQPPEQTLKARVYARRTLEAGFTTLRDLGSDDQIDVALREAIAREPELGPRLLVARKAIGSRGGHADMAPFPTSIAPPYGPEHGVCGGADSCREAVRWQLKYGADVIKLMPSGGVLSLADPVDVPQLTTDELRAIVEEAHAWHKKAAAHCHGDAAAKLAIAAGVDSIEHGSFLKPDTLALMKSRGTVLVPTLMAFEEVVAKAKAGKYPPAVAEKALAAGRSVDEMFKNAIRAGVKIAAGTDAGVMRHGRNGHELTLMVQRGLSPAAALRAATIVDAELLGVADRLGTLEKGKIADVIAVPGNPLSDITAVERVSFVMKEGRIVVRR